MQCWFPCFWTAFQRSSGRFILLLLLNLVLKCTFIANRLHLYGHELLLFISFIGSFIFYVCVCIYKHGGEQFSYIIKYIKWWKNTKKECYVPPCLHVPRCQLLTFCVKCYYQYECWPKLHNCTVTNRSYNLKRSHLLMWIKGRYDDLTYGLSVLQKTAYLLYLTYSCLS